VKKYFITGLLIWIPLVITIWVLKTVVDVLDQSLLLMRPRGRPKTGSASTSQAWARC
jgi:uncharacterized membrane protein